MKETLHLRRDARQGLGGEQPDEAYYDMLENVPETDLLILLHKHRQNMCIILPNHATCIQSVEVFSDSVIKSVVYPSL